MRLRIFSLAFLSLIFTCPEIHAGKITVKGYAPAFSGKQVQFYHYADYLSFREKRIDISEIDGEGRFILEFDTEELDYISVQIEDKRAHLYCEPGAVYQINLNEDAAFNKDKLFDKKMTLRFSFPKQNEINNLVLQFINDYISFLEKNEKLIVARRAGTAAKTFINDMILKYEAVDNAYFQKYLKYNLGILEHTFIGNNHHIYENFFDQKPVESQHYEYMLLFHQFYQKKFTDMALGKKGFKVLASINGTTNYSKLAELVQSDPFVSDDPEFCELFILNGLQEAFHEKELFKEHKVLAMLRYIQQNSVFDQHRKMAENLLFNMTYLTKGTPAPDFKLADKNGNMHSLEDFKGKYLYVHFWSTWSTPSIREMTLMKGLYEKYGPQIQFLSINVDEEAGKMEKQLGQKKYEWSFYHFGNDPEIRDRYQVRTLPTYVLIDDQGAIVQYPAERPTGGIEQVFFELSRK